MTVVDLKYGAKYQLEIDKKNAVEKRLASKLGLPKDQIMLNYGANSVIIQLLSALSVQTLAEKGRKLRVLLDVPNYFFLQCQLEEWQIDIQKVERDEELEFPFQAYIDRLATYPDVAWLTTPNNPTGKPITDESIRVIIESASSETLVVIDRSCLNILPEISSKELLKQYPHRRLAIIHSFSKSHDLSEERLGYLATNDRVLAKLLSNKRDLNHNLHALERLLQVMDNGREEDRAKAAIRESRRVLKEFCDANSQVSYIETFSSFCLLKLSEGIKAKKVARQAALKGVAVMAGEDIGMDARYLRVYTGSPDGLRLFLDMLKLV
ncbi:aminotransferase class I/II-fold pyridoxal phosphate-dependent enzyme [Patescibacteria group bacterium]|nr:aminotransferase class I/II-fold pyridoxal phosphate-dependent enzyme [Patescibacteria group bacterium]